MHVLLNGGTFMSRHQRRVLKRGLRMKHIPPVMIAAVGTGLIGVVALAFGMREMFGCFDAGGSSIRCWLNLLNGWMYFLIVFICAGIGGAITSRLFGRIHSIRWIRTGFALLGGALSTLIGGAIAGLCLGIFVSGSLGDIFEAAIWGSVFGIKFAFSTWFAVFLWIVGFLSLDVIVGKAHSSRTLTQTERAAS